VNKQSRTIFGIFILVVASVFIWWQSFNPAKGIILSENGMDNRVRGETVVEVVKIGEMFTRFTETEAKGTENWTRFRGDDFDNISKSEVSLIDKFPVDGPKVLWKTELGEGHSGAAIYNGLAYIIDYDESRRADMLRCYDLVNGEEIWQRGYRVSVKRNHGMSRTVPAINENYILTIGPKGHAMCLDRETGDLRWGIDLLADYESVMPQWYTAQCPLIDNNVAILAPGGNTLMIGVDCESGEILWETPNPEGWKMSHASIMPWTFGGRKMYVYSGVDGVFAVAADGDDLGSVLWSTSEWKHSVVAPSALCFPDGKVFLSAGYGAGSMMIQVSGSGTAFSVKVLDEYKPNAGLASEQQTPLFYGGKVFGILPKDAGPMRNQMICVNPSDPKKIIWSSGKDARFGLGPYIIADNKIFILSDEGELTIARLSTRKWELLDTKVVLDGHDAWAPIAIADGYMILRDSRTVMCLDMRK